MKNLYIIIIVCFIVGIMYSCSNKTHSTLTHREYPEEAAFICNYFDNPNPAYSKALLDFRDSIKNESCAEFLYYGLRLLSIKGDTAWVDFHVDRYAAQFFRMKYGDNIPYVFDVAQKYSVFATSQIFNQVFIETAYIQKRECVFKTRDFVNSPEDIKKEFRSFNYYFPSMRFTIYKDKIISRDFERTNPVPDTTFPWE